MEGAGASAGGKCCVCGGQADMCPATDCIGDKLLFVDASRNPDCPLLAHFGYEQYCRCPTRLEVYRRDKK
jgi:hypothetical protein